MKEAFRRLKIGVSGVRGVVGESLSPILASDFAAAFGEFVGGGRVLVGRDTRSSGEMYENAVAAGLLSVGVQPVHQPGRLRLARHRHIKSPCVQRAERFDRIRRPLLRHVKGQIGRVDPPPRETVIVHGGRARMPDRRADQGE